jgi:hypothetical protein
MANPAGKWNQMYVVCRENQLRVDLNGERIVDLNMAKKLSRPKPLAGYIGLQDHGLPLEFRNINIKRL